MSEPELKKTLLKRLLPLYVAAFFQSLVFWYTIEKLFMRSIGFNNTTIGLMVALYSAVMLAVETPSGILADRWSRKGVLMIASIGLSLSALIGGLSHSIGVYLFSAIFWGAFFACYSGMHSSIIYDTLAEEGIKKSSLFDFFYGRVQLVESIALILSGLVGGLVAELFGLRAAYFLSIPSGFAAILALKAFREPTLHKAQAIVPIQQQIQSTFRAIINNRSLLPVVIVLIIRSALVYTIYEFAQLWLIELHTKTGYYGLAFAVLFLSMAVGGILTHRLKLSRYPLMLATISLVFLSCIGLIVLRSAVLIVACQFIFATSLIAIFIIFNRILNDGLSSSIRAGALSATSTIGRFLIIPLALLFGYLSQKFTVYKAAYILLALTAIMALFIIQVANRNNHRGLEPN